MSFPNCLWSRVLCTESYSSKEKRWRWQLPLKDDKMALKCNPTGDQKTSADFFWGQKHRNWCAVWKEVYPTQPSFISLSTHSLASTENNSRFRSKLAWFNLVLLVETEKWSLWKDGYGREKWGSSSLLKTKVTATGEGTAAIKICWDCWKKEIFKPCKLLCGLGRLSLLSWLDAIPSFLLLYIPCVRTQSLLCAHRQTKVKQITVTQLQPLLQMNTSPILI